MVLTNWTFDDAGSFYSDIISEDLLNLQPMVLQGEGGFGPGDYSGGYTGQGDTIYWGASDGAQGGAAQGAQGVGAPGVAVATATVKSGFGPGFVVGDEAQGVDINSQANSEGLGTSSQSGAADDTSFTGQVGQEMKYRGFEAVESGTEGTGTITESAGTAGQPYTGAIEMEPLVEPSSGAGTVTTADWADPSTISSVETGPSLPGTSTQGAGTAPGSVELQQVSWDADTLPEVPEWRGTFRPGFSEPSLEPSEFSGFEEPSISGPSASNAFGGTRGAIQGFGTRGPYESLELTAPKAAPMLLDDVPLESEYSGDSYTGPSRNFDMGKLDFSKLPSAELEALSDVISDPSNISMGSDGIGWNPTSFTGFFKARAMDLSIGGLLMPIFNWIDETSGTPWVSRGIQATMATIGLILGGDPFGVVAAPIAWGVQEYMKQRKRLIENNDPEANQGKKFGYVREGNKWYPAILTSVVRDEGWIGSNHSEIRMAYGTNIEWKKEKGTDTWVPYFADGTYHMKDFHVWDSEVDDPENEGGKEYGERVDPMRDFYMLTEAQTTEMLTGMAGGSTFIEGGKDKVYTESEQAEIQAAQQAAYKTFGVRDQVAWDDTWKQADKDHPGKSEYAQQDYYGQWGGYVDTLDDLRQSMDFMQDYRYSDDGQLQTSNFGENEFEGSRALRDAVNSGGYLGHPMWEDSLEGGYYDQGSRPQGWDSLMTEGMKDNFKELPEMKVLTDAYVTAMNDLYASQKLAGTSMGYNDLYGRSAPEGWLPAFHEGDERVDPGRRLGQKYDFPLFESASVGADYVDPQDGATNISRATKDNGWALYQDNTWKFGPLDTAKQLHDAISLIEESGDSSYAGTMHYRSSDQRSYLAQKAYTRYLYAKMEELGGMSYLNSETDRNETWGKVPRDNDPSRVQYSDLTKIEWGRNPIYSELDDHGDSWKTYVPPGRRYTGLEGTGTLSRFGEGLVDWEYVLKDAGILSDNPEEDPDYVAGRFDSVEQYNTYLDPDAKLEPIEEETVDDGWDKAVQFAESTYGGFPMEYMGPDGIYVGDEAAKLIAEKRDAEPDADAKLDEPIGALASAFAIGHDVTEEEAAALDATYTPITVGTDETPTFTQWSQPDPEPADFFSDDWGGDAPFGRHKDGTVRKHPKKGKVYFDGTGTAPDDTLQQSTDWTPHEDTYVPGPLVPPDHPDDHSDTEFEPRPIYHMDEYHAHDPTPAPTHIPQNIKVI